MDQDPNALAKDVPADSGIGDGLRRAVTNTPQLAASGTTRSCSHNGRSVPQNAAGDPSLAARPSLIPIAIALTTSREKPLFTTYMQQRTGSEMAVKNF